MNGSVFCRFCLRNRHFMKTNILHHCPNDTQTTRFCRKSINLVSTLANIAKETLNRVRGLNMSIHAGREGIKGQEMFLIFQKTANRFWIALRIFRLERGHIAQGVLLLLLFPDPCQLGLYLLTLAAWNGIEDVALFVNQTALTWRRRKQLGNRREQALVPIGDKQIDLCGSRVRISCRILSHPSLLSSAQARSANTS